MQRDPRLGLVNRYAMIALVLSAAVILSSDTRSRAESSSAAPSGRNMSYYDVRRGLFALSQIKTAPIVMLGDSLTEAGPWTDLTGCLQIANRGIGGDTTKRLLDRLDDVVALRPKAIFLMIGVNDVSLGVPGETTLGNLRAILDRLSATDARVFLSYILPVTASFGKKRMNGEIETLNTAFAKLTADQAGVTLLDARPQLRGADGSLRREFAYDGLHLTPRGYAVLRDTIAPHVAEYCPR